MKLRAMATVLLALLLITATDGAGKRSQKSAMDLYCERDNCYDVLGVESKATKSEIKRAFRSISKQHHPDMKSKDPNSPTIFQAAANAYEILTDEEARENYDYYIAHPEEHMANQFRYYRQAAKKINVVPVLIMLLIVITIIKYLSDQFRYDSAVTNWKAWDNVQVRAKKEALKVLGPPKKSQKRTGHSKKAVQEAMDKWMTNQIESGNIQGLPSEPALKNLFIVHLVIFPYTLYQKVVWYHGFRRRLNGNMLTEEDEVYLTYSTLGKTEKWWKRQLVYETEQTKELLSRRLWEGENLQKYKETDGKYGVDMTGLSKGWKKQYRRYLKAKKRKGE